MQLLEFRMLIPSRDAVARLRDGEILLILGFNLVAFDSSGGKK